MYFVLTVNSVALLYSCLLCRLKHGLLCANLPTVQAALSQQKAVLSALREDILRKDQLFVQESQGLAKSVEVVCTGQIAGMWGLTGSLK